MNKLLNRFAWGIALALGLLITKILGREVGLYGFESVWLAIPITLLIKRFFLGQRFIEERIYYFANTLKGMSHGQTKVDPIPVKEEKKPAIVSPESQPLKTEVNKKNIIKKAISTPNEFDIYMAKVGAYIKDFFATNTLAKIGGVLIFLAVAFFLLSVGGALWMLVGPVGKLVTSFIISFFVFKTGVSLYNKGTQNEGLILMGLSILISYIIILSGRYLIGENLGGGDGFLTEGVTFLLLILNTFLGVITSLVYKSRTLLIFSFVFAYLNPLIIGAESNGQPYTLIGYSLILTLGVLFLSYKDKNITLLIIGFILGNLLILIAPVSDNIGWNVKLISSIFLGIITFLIHTQAKRSLYISGAIFGFFALNIGTFPFAYGVNQTRIMEFSGNSLFYSVVGFSLLLLCFFYYYSLKKDFEKLYTIASVAVIGLLGFVISNNETLIFPSVGAILLFALANWILPFINKNLLENKNNIGNLIIGSLAGVLFIAFQIYSFGEVYFPGIAQGIAFGGLAIIYFIQSYFIVQKIGTLSSGKKSSEDEKSLKNIFYTYAGISLSLFSLAIAFVFSNYPEIISTVWLFEATILYYFYSKSPHSISTPEHSLLNKFNSPCPKGREAEQSGENKLLIAGNILFAIGIFKLGLLLDIVHKEDYKFLVSFGIIAASLILNIRFIDSIKNVVSSGIHYILHILGIGVLAALLSQIIISNEHGWSSFGISAFIFILGFFYSLLKTDFLKWFFVFILGAFAFFHIGGVDYVFRNLERNSIEYFKILQYIVSGIVIANYFIWRKFNKHHLVPAYGREIGQLNFNKIILIIVSIYTFIISNIYILDIFENIFGHFSLTIYWGLIASALLYYGIIKNIIKFRTIGLYFVILTSTKIFLFDIWMIGNTGTRVLAFMGLGVLFITISTFYTKRYGNYILGELHLDNLEDWDKKKSTESLNPLQNKPENSFMDKLENVKIDNVKVVRFSPKKSENFTVRAKNLMKISELVIKQTGKTSFKPKELNGFYNYVVANYKSNLSRREHDKIRTNFKMFVEEGGEVEVVQK